MGHIRDLPDGLFGGHEEAKTEGDDCYGSMCTACGCCMHCSEGNCACTDAACGCADHEALIWMGE